MMAGLGYPRSYAHYAPAVVDPPEGSDVIEHWEVLYRIAQRMGLQLVISAGWTDMLASLGQGTELDMVNKPTTDDLLDILCAGGRIPLSEIREPRGGRFYPTPQVLVEPKDPGWAFKLDVGNADMMADITA